MKPPIEDVTWLKSSPKIDTTRALLSQGIVTFVVGLMRTTNGIMFAFPVLIIGKTLETDEDILSLDKTQASWYGSILFLILPLVSLLSGLLQHFIGRRQGLWIASIVGLIAYVVTFYATNFYHLLVSITLMAVSIGSTMTPGTAYLSDVMQTHLRGSALCLMTNISSSGFFIIFCLDTQVGLSWRMNAVTCASLPVLCMILLFLIPESPSWLVTKGYKSEAIKSLCWLRGWVEAEAVQSEFSDICHRNESPLVHEEKELENNPFISGKTLQEKPLQTAAKKKYTSWLKISHPTTVRPLLFVTLYGFFTIFSSLQGIRTYLFTIFEAMGSSLESEAFILGIACVLGNVTCVATLRWVGKKKLSLITMCNSSLISILLGVCIYYKDVLPTPFIFKALFYLIFYVIHCGFQSIPWVLMGEVFPPSIKSFGIAVSSTLLYTFYFACTKSHFLLQAFLGIHGTFIVNGVIGLVGCLYSYYAMPETEGKTFAEIGLFFSKGRRHSIFY